MVPELKGENGNEIELVMYTDIPPGRVRYLWWGTRINMRALRGYGMVRQSDRRQGSVRKHWEALKGCTHRAMILCDGAVDSHRKE